MFNIILEATETPFHWIHFDEEQFRETKYISLEIIFTIITTELFLLHNSFPKNLCCIQKMRFSVKRGDDSLYFSHVTILQKTTNSLCQLLN